MKFLLVIISLIISQQPKPLQVIEIDEAIPIKKGLLYSSDDINFNFEDSRYLALEISLFVNNKLASFQSWHSEGYLTITRENIKKDKGLIEYYGQPLEIKTTNISDKILQINSKKFVIKKIDDINKAIYYIEPKEKKRLYRLLYR